MSEIIEKSRELSRATLVKGKEKLVEVVNGYLAKKNTQTDAEEGNMLQLISKNFSGLSAKDLKRVIKSMNEDFPRLREAIKNNELWKQKYDEKGFLGKWWKKSDLEEKKEETLFLLTETSTMQLDAVYVILQISVLLGQMQSKLKEQQDCIAFQQNELEEQQEKIQEQNERLLEQQNTLNEQNSQIITFTEQFADNDSTLLTISGLLDNIRVYLDTLEESTNKDLEEIKSQMCKNIELVKMDIEKNIDEAFDKLYKASQTITW